MSSVRVMLRNTAASESMAGSDGSPSVLAATNEDRTLPRDAEEGFAVQPCPPDKGQERMRGPLIAENPQPRQGVTYSDAAAAHVYETGFRNTSTFRLCMLC